MEYGEICVEIVRLRCVLFDVEGVYDEQCKTMYLSGSE